MMSFQEHEKKPVAIGPCGGPSGAQWDDGVYSAVRQIVITHGAGIDSIQIEYDKQGSPIWADKHGGNGGYKTDKVKLAYPEEFLTYIQGYYGHLYPGGPVCVRSLTFVSNLKTHGPFGVDQGTYFSIPKVGDRIVGFCGRSGWYLDAIGAYLKPVQQKSNSEAMKYAQRYAAKGADPLHQKNDSKAMQYGQSYAPNGADPLHQKNDSKAMQYAQGYAANYADPIHQKNGPKALQFTQSYVASGVDKSGYSVIQGSLGKEYDIVLAIKQKDNSSSFSPKLKGAYPNAPRKISSAKSSSSDSSSSSDDESKEKVSARPPSTEKKPSLPPGVVTHGPWGGSGGSGFDDGVYPGIRQIKISRNVGIVYVKVLYEKDGKPVRGNRGGGTGGFFYDTVVFDYPYEILTHITGYYGSTMVSPTIIKSLTFHTTKKKYGPFGEEIGVPFTSKSIEGMIVGFHGRKGLFLDSIGVHIKEGKVTPQVRPPPALQDESKSTTDGDPLWPSKPLVLKGAPFEEPSIKLMKEPAPCGPGPWGGEGGKPWDDGVYTGIKQIFLTRAEVLCSIQIEYDRNGQSVWSVKHGGQISNKTHRIKLEYPHEVLTCISGYYGPVSKDDHARVIRSLTFYTSRGKYGPFGDEVGTFFTSTTTQGKVLGFHGRSGSYLDAIGVHMQHWLGNYKQPKSSFFGMFGY